MVRNLGNLGCRYWLIPIYLIWTLSGCKSYKQHIMFKTDKEIDPVQVATAIEQAQGNYRIQKK